MMQFSVTVTGDLVAIMRGETKAGASAVTAGMTSAATGLKAGVRGLVTGAGLGTRLANTWRSKVYPEGQPSISAAAYVYSKAPGILSAYIHGAHIKSKRGTFLAIPLPAAGKGSRGSRLTPRTWQSKTGLKLRFVGRPGRNALLVADKGARVSATGKVGARRGKAAEKTTVSVPVFALVRQVVVKKRIDTHAEAARWAGKVPSIIISAWKD